jgi:hypothetical protein
MMVTRLTYLTDLNLLVYYLVQNPQPMFTDVNIEKASVLMSLKFL